MSFVEPSVEFIEQFIIAIDYPGLALLMALDATILPLPSAAIMGFAGYACYLGHMNIILVTLVGAVGSVIGSMSMYALARLGGRPFLDRHGKYLGLEGDNLSRAEKWFNRYGDRAVLISQLFPIVRDLIPFPAGVAKMDARRYALFSLLGSLPFCGLLAAAGMLAGPAWQDAVEILDRYDIILVALFAIAVVVYYVLKKRKRSKNDTSDAAD
ncbi:MAG: DedA family protein [Euryarchaeota archaeon]|nr:DedA family protein [Euryarchaeota archaeon]